MENVILARQCVAGTLSDVCDRLSLLAVRADGMLHISLRLVLRSARGAGFDDRLLFHSGVTQIILRHFQLIAYSFSFGTP